MAKKNDLSSILLSLMGEFVQIVTTQRLIEASEEGVAEGPMGITGYVLDIDSDCILVDPRERPPRAVMRAHIVSIDLMDEEDSLASVTKDAMNDPGKKNSH